MTTATANAVRVLLTCFFAVGSGVPRAFAEGPTARVAIAPFSTLGNVKTDDIEATFMKAATNLVGEVISSQAALKAAHSAKAPELKVCEGEIACLARLGHLLAVPYVVAGEVGGLGDAQVVYLKLVDVAKTSEVRSTTWTVQAGEEGQRQAKAAATRLLAPKRHTGTLVVKSSIEGAIVFVDGHKVATTPADPLSIYVGSHALRVTHPEHRDFIRWIEVEFDRTTELNTDLSPLPGLSQELRAEGELNGRRTDDNRLEQPAPWYLRWYTIAGGIVLVGATSALIVGAATGDISTDAIREL